MGIWSKGILLFVVEYIARLVQTSAATVLKEERARGTIFITGFGMGRENLLLRVCESGNQSSLMMKSSMFFSCFALSLNQRGVFRVDRQRVLEEAEGTEW